MIACVLMRHFASAVERRARPELASQPLILARYQGDHERVYAASAEAGGVEPGMKLAQAQVICPEAQVVPVADQPPARWTGAARRSAPGLQRAARSRG